MSSIFTTLVLNRVSQLLTYWCPLLCANKSIDYILCCVILFIYLFFVVAHRSIAFYPSVNRQEVTDGMNNATLCARAFSAKSSECIFQTVHRQHVHVICCHMQWARSMVCLCFIFEINLCFMFPVLFFFKLTFYVFIVL